MIRFIGRQLTYRVLEFHRSISEGILDVIFLLIKIKKSIQYTEQLKYLMESYFESHVCKNTELF